MTDTNEPTAAEAKSATKRPRKMAREPRATADQADAALASAPPSSPAAKSSTKSAQVLELLQRPDGATIDQLVTATGWLPHTARAALTGLKKKGHAVTSDRLDGQGRVYRVVVA